MRFAAWFKGIRGRLLAVAILPVIGFVISSGVAFSGINQVGGLLDAAHDEIIPATKALNHLIIARNNLEISKSYEKRADEESKESERVQGSVFWWTGVINTTASLTVIAIILLISSRMANGISTIASKLSGASGNVTSSVVQLSEAGSTLSQSSTEAAASLEETVASLEELTSMVQVNSDNARQAAAVSASSRSAAEAGESEIRGLI